MIETQPAGLSKPLDFGNGLVAGSVAHDGALLFLGSYHPELGYAGLDTAAPFDERRRHEPAAVRAYRAELAEDGPHALGLRPSGGWRVTMPRLDGQVMPHHQLASGPLRASVMTLAPSRNGTALPCVIQHWRFRHDRPTRARLEWSGRLWLGRAMMTQLTEGGVLPLRAVRQRVASAAPPLTIVAEGAALAVSVAGLAARAQVRSCGPSGFEISVPVELTLASDIERELTIAVGVGSTAAEASANAAAGLAVDASGATADVRATWRAHMAVVNPMIAPPLRPLVGRALIYALCCCAVPVDDGSCLITDHRILPLSWTRDAYYIARMLLTALDDTGPTVVRLRLRWLFTTCERSEGAFARSYLPNGRIKDPAFQLDQQCYPLLELGNYVERTGDSAVARAATSAATDVLDAIESRRTPGTSLYATDETPGDDPLDLPYHFSSHVLLWHTLKRLIGLADELALDGSRLRRLAAAVRATSTAFVIERPDGDRFAYAVDAEGSFVDYHDANDLPTVLAPAWGFCGPDDPTWRSTMRFAFSPANRDGFFAGPFGGLGSVHTPGAWPLGDVQEYLYARVIGDSERTAAVTTRLAATACVDGALPEARDEKTGQVRSRHWFAWPGAALALALLDPSWRL